MLKSGSFEMTAITSSSLHTVPVIIDFTEREGVKFETFTSIEFTKFNSPPY